MSRLIVPIDLFWYHHGVQGLLHALVIDDEPQIRELIAEVLRDDGWTVEEARSADEAIAQLEKKEWSLVFCDVVLGGPDGYSVLQQFTQTQPEASFILITGQGSAVGALEATSTGAYDYLQKPFSIYDIIRISASIRDHLKIKRQRGKKHQLPRGYESDLQLIGTSSSFV